MTSDFYISLSSQNAEKIGESTYKWDLPIPIQLEENARFECGLVWAVIPSVYRANIAPPGIIRYKLPNNDAKDISLKGTQFNNLDALIDYWNASIDEEISKQASLDENLSKYLDALFDEETSKYIVFAASNSRVHLQVNEPLEYVEFTPSFSHFLGFENVNHFLKGNHHSPSLARLTMFSNQLSVYTDFTKSRICSMGNAPLLASFVIPYSGQYLESVHFDHIEYIGLTRLDLRAITMTINHTYGNEPFNWFNPMNHYLSFTLHFRRANSLFNV